MQESNAFVELALEHWRMIRVLSRLIHRLPEEAQARVQAQVRFAASKLESLAAGQQVQIVVFDGRPFDASLPVTVANADEINDDADLIVGDTLEPTILCNGQILQTGRVLLAKGTANASGY